MENTKKALEVLLNVSKGEIIDAQTSLEIQKYIGHLEVVVKELQDQVHRRNLLVDNLRREVKELKNHKTILQEVLGKREAEVKELKKELSYYEQKIGLSY
jgi:predicted nuclease with TOPRIM domain